MSTTRNNWVLQTPINLAGVALFEEIDDIATGYYKAKVVETDYHTRSGETVAKSIIFRMRLTEPGSEQGKTAAKWIGLEDKDGNKRSWKAALLSVGANPAALEGNITPQASFFTDKECYLHIVTPPLPEGETRKSDGPYAVRVNFITKQSYQERRSSNGTAGAGGGFHAQGAAPAMPGAAVTPPPAFGPQGAQAAAPAQQGGTVVPLQTPPPNGGGAPASTMFDQPPPAAQGPAGGNLFGPGPSA